jgi:hypothetical protein
MLEGKTCIDPIDLGPKPIAIPRLALQHHSPPLANTLTSIDLALQAAAIQPFSRRQSCREFIHTL